MPLAPHQGMGHRSRSSPTLSNPTSAPTATPSTASSPVAFAATPTSLSTPSIAPSITSPTVPSNSSSRSSSSSRPGFLSRLSLPLSLPLRSRNRNVTDFHIRPEEPHRRYSAGDHVRGSVVLVVVKPVRITHLVVSLHGYVRVLKDPTAVAKAQNTIMLPQGGGSTRARYHGHGLASLFQDEQVLSGEGRLEAGKYEFGFDLVFPEKGLPSSIDFERGTVSYMITATLTRPTSIAPTSSCERKVMLVENVDIGLLQEPRPRTIFLEPISKRTRRKKSTLTEKTPAAHSEVNDLGLDAEHVETPIEESRDAIADPRSPTAQSDMRSEVSGESGLSASTGVSRNELALSQVGTLTSSAQQQELDRKTITASIELLRGGCLPGDSITVRITIQHIKRVKSMTGIIVTLYRQGKIDSSPPESSFEGTVRENGRRGNREEAYPRSRTGLGGLILSSSGSTSMFRKDLDQNIAPLIIDPTTMQTSVTVSVKLPDDSFPTITGVPGEMISFRYMVEVVVDLGGRLSNQLQSGAAARFASFSHGNSDNGLYTYGPRRGQGIADTSVIRHEKGVVFVSLETIVGTVDSNRGRKRSRASPTSRRIRIHDSDDEDNMTQDNTYMDEVPREPYPHANGQSSPSGYFTHPNGSQHQPPPAHPPQPYSQVVSSPTSQPSMLHHMEYPRPHTNEFSPHVAAPMYVPPPEVQDQNGLSEKERVRQAETRLLPSQPSAAGPSNSNEEDDIYDAEDTPRPPPLNTGFSPSASDAIPSAPTEDDIATATAPSADVVEDKQELERRRLINEASAPPEFPDDMDRRNGGPSNETAPTPDPSAPALNDVDEFPGYGSSAGPSQSSHNPGEQLPAYQR